MTDPLTQKYAGLGMNPRYWQEMSVFYLLLGLVGVLVVLKWLSEKHDAGRDSRGSGEPRGRNRAGRPGSAAR